jgi:subtilase family serine protease
MFMAYGVKLLTAGAVGVAAVAAAAGLAATGSAPQAHRAPQAARAPVAQVGLVIRPSIVHLRREAKLDPATTDECLQSLHVACYNANQVQQAYNLTTMYARGVTGKGRTIVIADDFGSPAIASDLRTFDAQEGVPDPPSLRIIRPAGKIPRYNPNNADMVGWASETTLDVEWAHAIAPGAKILLVETPGGGGNGLRDMQQTVTAEKYVISHHLGDVISQSWATTEQAMGASVVKSLRGAYTAAQRAHVTVLAASGDSGATDLKGDLKSYYTYPVTGWPASDPLVTAVGGTRLNLDSSGNRNSADTVWNDSYSRAANELVSGDPGPSALAGGGGKSVIFGRPSYQNAVARVTGNHRGVPDISMSAACTGTVNVYQSFGGEDPGWYAVCGTSESSPMFAGIVALAAQVAKHPLGLINPALYKLAAQHARGIVRITSGSNTVTFRQGGRSRTVRGFTARGGYSLAGGLGTVNAAYLVPELARLAGH